MAKLDIITSRLVTNDLIFAGDTPVDVQYVTLLLLSKITKIII